MSSYVFPGYPSFLEAAGRDSGHLEAARAAARIVPLTALANLCAQASHCDPSHVAGILAKAEEFHHQLEIAAWAAELMLAEVAAARSQPVVEAPAGVDESIVPDPSPGPRASCNGETTSRGSS